MKERWRNQTIGEPVLFNCSAVDVPPPVSGDDFAETVDDATIDYVLAAQKSFRKLRQGISQIAGALVLEAASSGRSEIARNGFELARASMVEVRDLLAEARPTSIAAHHHHHLKRAIAAVERALASPAYDGRLPFAATSQTDILPLLKEAWAELSFAGRALPGFEVVDFGQACCAFHRNNKR